MDRPKRAKISTRNYGDYYYPTLKRKERKNAKKTPERDPQNSRRQLPKNPSTSSTQNPPISRPPSPIPAEKVTTSIQTQEDTQTTKSKKDSHQLKAATTQTIPKATKNLTEILNELYTNPDFPTAFGGQLKKFILSKDSISKHRQRRKIFKRRKV